LFFFFSLVQLYSRSRNGTTHQAPNWSTQFGARLRAPNGAKIHHQPQAQQQSSSSSNSNNFVSADQTIAANNNNDMNNQDNSRANTNNGFDDNNSNNINTLNDNGPSIEELMIGAMMNIATDDTINAHIHLMDYGDDRQRSLLKADHRMGVNQRADSGLAHNHFVDASVNRPIHDAPRRTPVEHERRPVSSAPRVAQAGTSDAFLCPSPDGIYADPYTGCQAYHVCQAASKTTFKCPLGTLFNNAILTCDFAHNVDCVSSHRLMSSDQSIDSTTGSQDDNSNNNNDNDSNDESEAPTKPQSNRFAVNLPLRQSTVQHSAAPVSRQKQQQQQQQQQQLNNDRRHNSVVTFTLPEEHNNNNNNGDEHNQEQPINIDRDADRSDHFNRIAGGHSIAVDHSVRSDKLMPQVLGSISTPVAPSIAPQAPHQHRNLLLQSSVLPPMAPPPAPSPSPSNHQLSNHQSQSRIKQQSVRQPSLVDLGAEGPTISGPGMVESGALILVKHTDSNNNNNANKNNNRHNKPPLGMALAVDSSAVGTHDSVDSLMFPHVQSMLRATNEANNNHQQPTSTPALRKKKTQFISSSSGSSFNGGSSSIDNNKPNKQVTQQVSPLSQQPRQQQQQQQQPRRVVTLTKPPQQVATIIQKQPQQQPRAQQPKQQQQQQPSQQPITQAWTSRSQASTFNSNNNNNNNNRKPTQQEQRFLTNHATLEQTAPSLRPLVTTADTTTSTESELPHTSNGQGLIEHSITINHNNNHEGHHNSNNNQQPAANNFVQRSGFTQQQQQQQEQQQSQQTPAQTITTINSRQPQQVFSQSGGSQTPWRASEPLQLIAQSPPDVKQSVALRSFLDASQNPQHDPNENVQRQQFRQNTVRPQHKQQSHAASSNNNFQQQPAINAANAAAQGANAVIYTSFQEADEPSNAPTNIEYGFKVNHVSPNNHPSAFAQNPSSSIAIKPVVNHHARFTLSQPQSVILINNDNGDAEVAVAPQDARAELPQNEPVLDYSAPGTSHRAELETELAKFQSPFEVPIIIDGKPYKSTREQYQRMPFEYTRNVAKFYHATPAQLKEGIECGLERRQQWDLAPLAEKLTIFERAADLVSTKYRARLNAATMLGQAKSAAQAEIDSAAELADFWRFNAHFMRTHVASYQPISRDPRRVVNSFHVRALDGFVAAITPFNFTAIGANLASAPLLAGNVVVWKPSDTAILSNYLVYQVLREAGLPDGVLNFVPADGPEFGDAITSHAQLGGINFTGSVATFCSLWTSVGANIKQYDSFPRLIGECGGKNYHFVHESASAQLVLAKTIESAFEYSGQKCSACSRLYVPHKMWTDGGLRDQLVEAVLNRLYVGPPTHIERTFTSAVIDAKAFKRIRSYIDYGKATKSTVKLLAGGTSDDSIGYYVMPTVFETSDPHDRLMREEIFGPVLTVYVYRDDQMEQTMDFILNTTPYALTGSIFATNDTFLRYAIQRLRMSAGNLYINDKSTGAIVGQQPFGGARQSGTNDKAGGPHYLYRWCNPQLLPDHIDDLPEPELEPQTIDSFRITLQVGNLRGNKAIQVLWCADAEHLENSDNTFLQQDNSDKKTPPSTGSSSTVYRTASKSALATNRSTTSSSTTVSAPIRPNNRNLQNSRMGTLNGPRDHSNINLEVQ
ncbi:Delta-1-pyrroline-5-carboxylate dehydrogenase, mitochondrial, partial [Fragariocoptes setiger]